MDAQPAAPLAHELVAPAGWRTIDFISDLHLADDTPRGFDAWERYLLGTPADAVLILGDLFEVWVGDDARDEGFEARCAAVLKRASAQRYVGFMEFILSSCRASVSSVPILRLGREPQDRK